MAPFSRTRFAIAGRLAPLTLALMLPAGGLQAQGCTSLMPEAGRELAAGPSVASSKFRMIEAMCPQLGTSQSVGRAAQLGLYDRPAPEALDRREPVLDLAPPVRVTPVREPRIQFVSAPPPVASDDPRTRRVLELAGPMVEVARENGIDPLLLHAIAHVESRHDPRAVSPAGARGLMQVMPATGARFGAPDAESLFNADTNLRASVAYLRTLKLRYHDDLTLVLAAYNAGEGAVDRAGRAVPPYPETQAYVRKVLAAYERLTEAFEVGSDGRLQSVGLADGGRR